MRLRNRVSSRDEPVAFHRLPLRDPERLRLWLSAAGLDVDSPVKSLRAVRVCSEHFSPDDYRLKDPGGEVNSQRLKSTAVPRAFQQKTERTETTLPELPEQHRIREKEEEPHGLESVHMAEGGSSMEDREDNPPYKLREKEVK
ncbi:hypothetical protein GJAV_G00087360 [Gymnothorax javanicus]|nr:hypothetical protein GJAV_G00087360 [Gymnothorax javanicus]